MSLCNKNIAVYLFYHMNVFAEPTTIEQVVGGKNSSTEGTFEIT